MKYVYIALASAFLFVAYAAHAAPVDINTADAKTLDQLKGVSPKTAQAIVAYRAKNGAFKSVDELDKVKGIGRATIEKNRANLTVGGK